LFRLKFAISLRKGLIENKNDVEIQRRDPNSPLFSVKSFEALNLKPNLLKARLRSGTPSSIYQY
jgi:ATP-dependent RNA helicase DDX19/DBP5